MGPDRGDSNPQDVIPQLVDLFKKPYRLHNADMDAEYGQLIPGAELPPLVERCAIPEGSYAKLAFSTAEDMERAEDIHPVFQGVEIEYLWVVIIAVESYTYQSSRYRGILVTSPCVLYLNPGAHIEFEARHVYEISDTYDDIP